MIMEKIYAQHGKILQDLYSTFHREVENQIDWNERLLMIKGARGIGKTTLILQHILKTFQYDSKALYVSMDSLDMADKRIYDVAEFHYNKGGTHLFIDEIHKYQNWSIELKNIYDKFRNLKVVVSGSSMLHLYKGDADLSRRAVTYVLSGLSFKEYLEIETKQKFENYTLKDILQNHVEIAQGINKKINALDYLKSYWEHGYYPFYLESKNSFHQKLNSTINQTIENDIPQLFHLELNNVNKIKRLLYYIAISAPYTPNSTKLAESLELSRQTLNSYFKYMEEGNILQLLFDDTKSFSLISKPSKIYLGNTNLCHLVPEGQTNIDNLRETFFMNQLKNAEHELNFSKIGDFKVNDQYIFEIGGSGKNYKQIDDVQNSFLVVDNQLVGVGNRIPLWLFGFIKKETNMDKIKRL